MLQSYLKLQQSGVRKFLHIKPLPFFFFFSSSFIYSLKLLYIFSENLAYFGNCNSTPRSICKTACTRHAEKAPPEFLPHGKVKPNFFQRQGEVCFLSEKLVSELPTAVFLTSTLLALGQKTPIVGFPILPLSLAELCPVGLPVSPAGALPSHLSPGPKDFHASSRPAQFL